MIKGERASQQFGSRRLFLVVALMAVATRTGVEKVGRRRERNSRAPEWGDEGLWGRRREELWREATKVISLSNAHRRGRMAGSHSPP